MDHDKAGPARPLARSSINPSHAPLRIDASGQAEVAVLAVLERVLGQRG